MGLHFLIIDDSDLNLKVISSLLSKLNISSDHVTSALDAYSLLENRKYDMILMDYMMPDVNGVEAAEYIRNMFSLGFNTEYFATLPIIMLTAEDNFASLKTANSYNGYLKKPVSLQSLEECIKNHLQEYSELKEASEKVFIEGLDADIEECYSYLDIFVSTVGNIIMTIRMALQTSDYNTYTVEVHRLKGEAQIISASALAQCAYELETVGKAVTGTFPNGNTEEQNLDIIKEKTPILISMVENLKNQFLQYKKFKNNITDADNKKDNAAASSPDIDESCSFDNETKNKIIRYLDYALESINDNNIVNAITWIDGIKEILNS